MPNTMSRTTMKTQLTFLVALAVLAAGGAYVAAQPKSAPAKPVGAPAANEPSAASPAKAPGPQGMHMGSGECPMHELASIADAKIEPTPQGAVIRLTAKRSEDIAKVQELAQHVAGCMTGSECMMHEHAAHGHGHGGMMMQPSAATPSPAVPAKR
jgi:hypothetical protein